MFDYFYVETLPAAVHVIDFYLDEAHEQERIQIIKLVQGDASKSTDLLLGYVREAMRRPLICS